MEVEEASSLRMEVEEASSQGNQDGSSY